MKIAILSDTHIKNITSEFINQLNACINEVDMVIHSGDYMSHSVIEEIKKKKDFIGVWGNVDGDDIKKRIKEKEIVILKGYRIGIFHGHGQNKTTFDRAYDCFKNDKVDIIVFGHSHQPMAKTKNGILLLNPGSITNKRREKWFSYIILELDDEKINFQFRFFK